MCVWMSPRATSARMVVGPGAIASSTTAELLFSTPYISASSLAKDLDVTFPTAQSAIDLLVRRGDLVETTGRKRNRFYFSHRIFDAVYGMNPETSNEQTSLFDVDPIG